jgi:hypothetical protein
MRGMRNTYRILVRKSEGKDTTSEMDLSEIQCDDEWIHVTQYADQW